MQEMSGRNHHFIPQLLQKGFSARRTRKGKHQVWSYRRGQPPLLTGIGNLFVEKDFYGPPPTPTVDRLITHEEAHRFDGLLRSLRSATTTQLIGPSEDAADFVHQISVRARWVRNFFEAAGQNILVRASYEFTDQARTAKRFKSHFNANPGWLRGVFAQQIEKHLQRPLSATEQSQLAALVSMLEANPQRLLKFTDPRSILKLIGELHETMSAHAEAGHLKGLERVLHTRGSPFRRFLQGMSWSVVRATPPILILGDCGPLHLDSTGIPLGPMSIFNRDHVVAVALPVSNSHLLLGRQKRTCPTPSPDLLNAASAAWSNTAFIANADTAANRILQTSINTRVEPFLKSELTGMSYVR